MLLQGFCTPGEGHDAEKRGLVENLVGYARRNFFTPVPQVDSWGALNAQLLARCVAERESRLRGETQIIGDLWAEEKKALLPLPPHGYECCRWLPARVNRYSLVTFETNRYSVPIDYVGRQVLVKAFVERLEVVWEDRVITTHPRCYAREQDVLDPQHFLRLLRERPSAWEHAKAIHTWQARWPKVYAAIWPCCAPAIPNRRVSAGSCASWNSIRPSASPRLRRRWNGPWRRTLLQTHCKRLRLPTLARNYAKFAQEAAQADQPYPQYLLALLEQEVLQREANQERRRIQAAKFPVLRTLDSFDFSMIPSVNKAKILELARGDYLAQCENILLVGEIGTGKTHLATALGVAACRQGKRVRFYTAANLVHALTEARDDRRLLRLQTQLMKQDLIVLDEVGFVPFSTQGSQLLFQFCSERYQRGSMNLTRI